MTTEEQKTVLDLASHTISEEEFLQRFGIRHSEGRKLALSILEDAYRRKDGLDAEYGLYVGFHFGFTADHLDILCRLSDADWHTRHEDVVTALGELRDKRTVRGSVSSSSQVTSLPGLRRLPGSGGESDLGTWRAR